jgi:hypothetical protein
MLARCPVWVAAALLTPTAVAQIAQGVSEKPVELVTITFAVTDHQGHLVKDLGSEQFTVLDNGKPAKARRI